MWRSRQVLRDGMLSGWLLNAPPMHGEQGKVGAVVAGIVLEEISNPNKFIVSAITGIIGLVFTVLFVPGGAALQNLVESKSAAARKGLKRPQTGSACMHNGHLSSRQAQPFW